MTGNPLPWLILLAVVVATLAIKGYIKVPGFPSRRGPANDKMHTVPRSSTAFDDAIESGSAQLMERLSSETLGVYFALAKRREAERELAHKIASDAGDAIKATFQAPFSPPAPAGQDKAKPADFPPIA